MKNKKILPLLVLSMLLTSCGTTTSSDQSSDQSSTTPSTSDTTESSTTVINNKTTVLDFATKAVDGIPESKNTASTFSQDNISFSSDGIYMAGWGGKNFLMLPEGHEFHNTSDLAAVVSIEIVHPEGMSGSSHLIVELATSSSFTDAFEAYNGTPTPGTTTKINIPVGKNYGYIRFSSTKKNVQLNQLKITYNLDGINLGNGDSTSPDDSSSGNTSEDSHVSYPIPDIDINLNDKTEACKSYYSGFNFDVNGNDLRDSLCALIRSKRKQTNTYSDLKSLAPKINCPIGQEGTIYVFYKGTTAKVGSPMDFSGDYNREHVWPDSRGAGKEGLGCDPFMLQPTLKADNSSRGNKFYTEPGDGGWTPEDDRYKGDCARLIMYGYTHYFQQNHLKLSDNPSDPSGNHSMGKISTLLEWHFKYPVNTWEKERNENGDNVIGLRNPFVDFPELAVKEFKNFNANTAKVCEKYGY